MKKWKCKICGYVHEGTEAPEKCPLCGATSDMFEEVIEENQESPEGVSKKWKCQVCGYIHEGVEPPNQCPLCKASKDMFVEVIEESAEEDKVKQDKPEEPEEQKKETSFLVGQILKHHLHPITVHTPNGVLPLALVFILLSVFTGSAIVDAAAFYNLIFVLLTMPVVLFTGVVVWKNRYGSAFTSLFKIKIGASIVVTATMVLLVGWRVADPLVLSSSGKWIYVLIALIMVGAAGLAGHMGGKLVFGGRD